MADREQHNGRMLFTDFDASDKGRPVAVLGAQALRELLTTNKPTLDEIAANLELDFEDDSDDAPTPTPAARTDDEEKKETGGRPAAPDVAREDDRELALGDAEMDPEKAAGAYAAPDPEEAPSWDELASAYERAKPAEEVVSLLAPAEGRLDDDEMLDDHFIDAPTGDDDSVDVLSMLDEWLENESAAAAPAEKPFPAPRPIPYGGVERVDEWFAPPENQVDPFARVDDWYEPPEPGTEEDPGETKVDIGWLGDFRNELPEGDYWRSQTRHYEKVDAEDAPPGEGAKAAEDGGADSEKKASSETEDLFDAMDVDSLWEQKIASKKQASRPQPDADTRQVNLFDNLDIESLWKEKQKQKRGDAPKAGGMPDLAAHRRAQGADETIIVQPDQLNADGTVILRDDVLARQALDFTRAREGKSAPAPRERTADTIRASSKEEYSAAAAANARDDVLAELDAIAEDEKPFAPAPPAPSAKAPALPPASTARAAGERTDTDTAGPFPSVKDDDAGMEAPAQRDIRDTPDLHDGEDDGVADLEALDEDGALDANALVEEAAGMDFDGEMFGGGDGGRDDEREYVARTPDPLPEKPKGLTTDDLLNDIDLDSLATESGDVSAPVIDDIAIDDVRGPRPGTEEMEAIVAQELEGNAGAGEDAPESIAVNPMDVFANMDDMDFSDDVDDEMRAMMEEEEGEALEGDAEGGAAGEDDGALVEDIVPATRLGRIRHRVVRTARRFVPAKLLNLADKALAMIAWRENWWFYCDLVAAVVASASLAVIFSYLFWYRGA